MMQLDAAIEATYIHDCPHNRMLNIVPVLHRLDFGPNDTMLVLEEGRQLAQAYPTVAVDRKPNNLAAVIVRPSRKVRAPAKEADTVGRPTDNQCEIPSRI